MDRLKLSKKSESIYPGLASPDHVYSNVGQTSGAKHTDHTMHDSVGQTSNKSSRAQHTDHTVYGRVGQTSNNNPGAQHIEKSEESSHPYRLAAVCLGLLCALLLTAIIALSVHYIRHKDQQKKNCTALTDDKDLQQKNFSAVLQQFPFLDLYCPLESQKRECRPCPQGWEQFNSNCYYFSNESKNWTDSRNDCLKQGGDLVIIDSGDEQDFITSHTKEEFYWIGLSDSETEGTWIWVDRTPLQKGSWRRGEPNDRHWEGYTWQSNADCAVTVRSANEWGDTPCYFNLKCVCETDALSL